MATVRDRVKTFGNVTGSVTAFGATTNRTMSRGQQTMQDVIGNYPYNSPMVSDLWNVTSWPTMNGRFGGVFNPTIATNYPVLNWGNVAMPGTPGDIPSDTASITQVAARTNPGKPSIDLPVFLGEMRDLPHLVKETGDFLLGRRGSFNGLSWTFGWEPLLRDLGKMINFTDVAEKRFQELNRLHKRGIRRNQTVFERSIIGTSTNMVLNSDNNCVVRGDVSHTTTFKKWVSISWKPSPVPSYDSAAIRDQAWKSTLGLSARPKIIWDLMPWSWLVDWFANVGDFLQASDNSVAVIGSSCVMLKKTMVGSVKITSTTSGLSCTDGSWYKKTMNRLPNPGIGLDASIPVLTGRQLSILGGLATSRFYGR